MKKSVIVCLTILMCLKTLFSFSLDDRLIPSLIQVESNGFERALGDNGRAKGCLQIWEVVVLDVNQFYDTDYTHDQMFYKNNSCEVATLYLTYWGKHYEKTKKQPVTNEVLARIWNGGPFANNATGKKKLNLDKYWEKVKNVLDNNLY